MSLDLIRMAHKSTCLTQNHRKTNKLVLPMARAVKGADLYYCYLGWLWCWEVKPGRNKVMLRHLGPVSPFNKMRHQTSWPGSWVWPLQSNVLSLCASVTSGFLPSPEFWKASLEAIVRLEAEHERPHFVPTVPFTPSAAHFTLSLHSHYKKKIPKKVIYI